MLRNIILLKMHVFFVYLCYSRHIACILIDCASSHNTQIYHFLQFCSTQERLCRQWGSLGFVAELLWDVHDSVW